MTKEVSYRSKRIYYNRRRNQRHFIKSPWSGGALLVAFAAVAMLLANLDATKGIYHHVLGMKLSVGFIEEGFGICKTVEEWVNDGLMVVFFFVVGLEIKREIIAGQLSGLRQAMLPVAAAVGGMIVPAAIYAAFNTGTPYSAGWGIPMATDIAFAIGVLSLLGNRVPLSMKIFLTALAIVDDLGAILVIALFYTTKVNLILLGCSALVVLLLWALNRMNVYRMAYYMVPSVLLWILFLYSGIHSTISGVLIAMLLPATPRFSKKYFGYKSKYFIADFRHNDRQGVEVLSNHEQFEDLQTLKYIATNSISPSQRLEHNLYDMVTFVIMPLFALVNAGVEINGWNSLNVFGNTFGAGIFLGLLAGKPLGILLFSWITIRLGWAAMPRGGSWPLLSGVACLGGIGFTMSIFIDNLAFHGTQFVDSGKITVLVSSLTASLVGFAVLYALSKRPIDAINEKNRGYDTIKSDKIV